MAIVAAIGFAYCQQEEVCKRAAERLGYRYLGDEELLREAAGRSGINAGKLRRAMHQPPSVFNKFTHEKEQSVAHLRAGMADVVRSGKAVYQGYATLLLPRGLPHVLRVCLTGDVEHRVAEAVRLEGMSEKDAQKAIKKEDAELVAWSQHLFRLGPSDRSLHDLIVPMHTTSVEEAVSIVCEYAMKPALRETPKSEHATADFILATRVGIELAKKGHDVDVQCSNGAATVIINKYTMRLNALEKELISIAEQVEGVTGVQTRVGPGFHQPNIYFDLDVEAPQKVLLVDDEKDFVQVLSERLQTRSMESAIAYNGEEALSILESDEPDVIVLDLKMPGIDGIETLRRVKSSHPDTEVIILTGHGSEREEALAGELGAFAYLHKPVDIDELAKIMKEAYRKVREARAQKKQERD
jgi:two-component system response regulator CpxR